MHEPRSIRGLPLATLAVIAAVATIAGVARWRAVAPVPARVPTAVTERPSGATGDAAIASRGRADAPIGSSHAAAERADGPTDGSHTPERADVPRASAPSDPPRLPPRVEAHARDAVDRYLTDAGLDDQLSGTDREALVTALGKVRASSRWLSSHAHARGDAESRRRQALLDADRVFRDTLGVGVGEFVAALAPPDTIEDLGATRQ